MTGTMTNPMSVDLRLWMEDKLTICPCLTFVRFITLLLLYILNCPTLSLNKTLHFMIWIVYLVQVRYRFLSSRFTQKLMSNTTILGEKISFST